LIAKVELLLDKQLENTKEKVSEFEYRKMDLKYIKKFLLLCSYFIFLITFEADIYSHDYDNFSY
jgi:hypothetical protein